MNEVKKTMTSKKYRSISLQQEDRDAYAQAALEMSGEKGVAVSVPEYLKFVHNYYQKHRLLPEEEE